VGGGWKEKVLHSFGEGEDGFQPYGGLIIDASGNLNGTTTFVGVTTTSTIRCLS
jgi:hypothetical protein